MIKRKLARCATVRVAAIAAVLASCGGDPAAGTLSCGEGEVVADRPLRVAATVAPITNIVAAVAAGTDTVVSGIVPEGTNSHTYEPAPSVAATIEDADVLFMNGLTLEEPTKELALANLGAGSEVCELGTVVLPESEYIFDFSFPEEAGNPNPHLWTNPPMALEYAELVRDVLVTRDPDDADVYRVNTEAFAASVDDLDAALRTATGTIPTDRRLLLTYHDAYAYFADEYGWTVLGAVQPSSFDEPTPRDVAELVDQIAELEVPAIFGSEVFPSPVLEQIAAETSAVYVDDLRDDDLPGAPGDADHSWFALMQFNFVTMVEALGGDAGAITALVPPSFDDTASYPQ
ncbi:MAG TPA: metal ABC transporter substrate-binding protein [Ilumatobacter sp.]|nr:metal ABC transporter substrate-binding protein [Ilumatobacter sp.]